MDTNNLDKWWYGLPGNTRQAIGNDGIWEKLDMPSRSALHRYSRLRIYGTAKDRDEERTLLNEIACGLGDLALVRKNGIALEEMCNGNGEFYDEYQEQFNILYDNYGHTIENISWPDWIGHTIPTNRELGRLLEHHGYKRMEIDTDRRTPKTFYVFRRGLHINASEDLSYHIVPQQDSFGLGRFAVCATKDGESFQLGTDCARLFLRRFLAFLKGERSGKEIIDESKYSINSLVYWVTYVHNVVYSFYRSMIYCYINSTQRCAGSIVIDIIPTNGADKRKFFPFAPYFPVTNVIKRYFYPYFPAIIGIKGYSFPYFPYLSGIMKIKTALYSLFSRLDWHKTVVFPCLGEIYEGIRSLSWEIPVT